MRFDSGSVRFVVAVDIRSAFGLERRLRLVLADEHAVRFATAAASMPTPRRQNVFVRGNVSRPSRVEQCRSVRVSELSYLQQDLLCLSEQHMVTHEYDS